MQMIVYPDEKKQPCSAQYGIFFTEGLLTRRAGIVVIASREPGSGQTPLLDSDGRRDALLNKILSTDLQGVRLDHTRFYILEKANSASDINGYEFPIQLDMNDYRRRGNPVEIRDVAPTSIKSWVGYVLGMYVRRETVYQRDVVGGCATVKADTDRRRHLQGLEAQTLLAAVDYSARASYSGPRLVYSR